MISIQVSVKQTQATASPSLIRACIQLPGARGSSVIPCPSSSAPTPSVHQPNILIDQASDAMLMGKLPLPVHSNERHPVFSPSSAEELLAALKGRFVFAERDLKRPAPSASKADDCLSSERPTKKSRRDPPTSSSPESSKKTVRFATEECELEQIIPTYNGHEYECQERWYNRVDYNEFRQDMKMNFFMHSLWMQQNVQQQQQKQDDQEDSATQNSASGPSPPEHLCIRGLEKFCFYSNQAAIKDMRRLRLHAVLDQQRIQKVLGTDDPTTLRLVAEVLSQRVSEQALERAANDYLAASS